MNLTEVPAPDISNILPTTIHQEGLSDIVTATTSETPIPQPTQSNQNSGPTIFHYLRSHQFYKRLIGPLVALPGNGSEIAHSLWDGSLLACCD